MYWFHAIAIDCWRIDHTKNEERENNMDDTIVDTMDGLDDDIMEAVDVLRSYTSSTVNALRVVARRRTRSAETMSHQSHIAAAAVTGAFPVAGSDAAANSITTFLNTAHQTTQQQQRQQQQRQQQRQQQQQQQNVFYACPMNNMCQCAGFPNETATLVEINCNEIDLYKFPGKS